MQVIYGQGNASNILLTAQKRLIRPAYAQTQGFPYASYLDPSLRNSDNSIRVPKSTDSNPTFPLTRSADAFTYNGSLIPGTVMVKTSGENACVANGANAAVQPWGLLDQWVGGTFDNVGQNNEIGIWMGPDSTYDLLAPAWNDTGLATAISGAAPGAAVYLYAGADGRLTSSSPGGSAIPVARVIQRWSAARLTIQLII